MIALFDIGNTHTHIGLANLERVTRHIDAPTKGWATGAAQRATSKFLPKQSLAGAALCSVVPAVTPLIVRFLRSEFGLRCIQLTNKTVRGVGINYPAPQTIGPDRLANAVAARLILARPPSWWILARPSHLTWWTKREITSAASLRRGWRR